MLSIYKSRATPDHGLRRHFSTLFSLHFWTATSIPTLSAPAQNISGLHDFTPGACFPFPAGYLVHTIAAGHAIRPV
jgi:hypothetical protein